MTDAKKPAEPIKGLHATLRWEPYLHVGDGERAWGYQRGDGAGYVIPQSDGTWWVTWAHPMLCGRPGWHHHAFGAYVDAKAGAMAFDIVFELERLAGNDARTGLYTDTARGIVTEGQDAERLGERSE